MLCTALTRYSVLDLIWGLKIDFFSHLQAAKSLCLWKLWLEKLTESFGAYIYLTKWWINYYVISDIAFYLNVNLIFTHLDLVFNFSCTSAKPPSRLQPRRITSSHTQKPSNTLCWAYLEQVTLNVCLYVHSVAVYPLNAACILWLFGKCAHLFCVLQVMWHTSLQPVYWISRGPQRSWSWRVWSSLL